MGILDSLSATVKITERPAFTSGTCLNRKQNKFTCTACRDVCPGKVFPLKAKEAMKWDRCLDCGLCVTACVSRCFTPSAAMQDVFPHNVQKEDAVLLYCDEDEELQERQLPCLGSMPWELMALISLTAETVPVVRSCETCTNTAGRQLLEQNLQRLKAFLGEETYAARIHPVRAGEAIPAKKTAERDVSRKDLFAGVKNTVVKQAYRAVSDRIPIAADGEPDPLQYRRMLSAAVLKRREQENRENLPLSTYGVELPVYNSACYGCNICSMVCPQKAIETGPEENGTRILYITPWKCTACGLCERLCPHGGIDGFRVRALPYLEKLPLVRVPSATCSGCGAAIRPETEGGLCTVCAAKAKRKLR